MHSCDRPDIAVRNDPILMCSAAIATKEVLIIATFHGLARALVPFLTELGCRVWFCSHGETHADVRPSWLA
jgi:hypothetical protein